MAKWTRRWTLLMVGVGDALAFIGGIALSYVDAVGFPASAAGSLFLVTVITFIGFLSMARDMRAAIAAAFIIVYFAVLFTIIFARVKIEEDIAKQIISNFTTLVTTVVAFYFGVKGVENVIRSKQEGGQPATPDQTDEVEQGATVGPGAQTRESFL